MATHIAIRLYRTANVAVGSAFRASLAPRFYATIRPVGRAFYNARLAAPKAFNCNTQLRRYSTADAESSKESPVEKEESNHAEHTNEAEEAAEDSAIDLEQQVEELQSKLTEVTEKLKELQLKYRISLDNCEQMEKISAKKLHNAKLYAITQFAKDMLDVADAFELAFKALGSQETGLNAEFIEGIRLTEAQLHKTFEKYGIKRFESLEHKFNPEVHEAVFEIPEKSVERNTILQVVFNGYMINERVLRAAKVGVSRK